MEITAYKFADEIWEGELDLVDKLGFKLIVEDGIFPTLDEISDGLNRLSANESEIDSQDSEDMPILGPVTRIDELEDEKEDESEGNEQSRSSNADMGRGRRDPENDQNTIYDDRQTDETRESSQ